VVGYPNLVQWCLDNGAEVDVPETPPRINAQGVRSYTGWPRPSILGMAASSGTIETFELLRARGAPLDPLMLHYAVDQATILSPAEGSDPSTFYMRRIDMVRHLLGTLKVDVNSVKYQLGTQCSTPLCFVARRGGTKQDFRELISFLLDHGADIDLDGGTIEGHHWPSPMVCAERSGNSNFLRSVDEWKARGRE
jgi:hypothetical protein